MSRRVAALLLAVAVAAGCNADKAVGSFADGGRGDSLPGDAVSGDAYGSGGSGNGVLRVSAVIEASEEVDNASSADQFKAELTVDVTRAGAAVTDAVVTIASSAGTVTLSHEGSGRYTAEQAGYARRYQLDVVAGADAVRGVRAEGPRIHTIDNPSEGARHPTAQPLEVRWTAGSATEVTVESERMPRATTTDSGRFSIAGTYLTAEAGKEETDRVRVRRSNVQLAAGGSAGSDVTVLVRNQVEFLIDAR
ncbi:MAG: hypothetical protein KC503_28055 [Myxococcales bacterium]|nr:hypothetical protein [Myxococcales bacterium]